MILVVEEKSKRSSYASTQKTKRMSMRKYKTGRFIFHLRIKKKRDMKGDITCTDQRFDELKIDLTFSNNTCVV